MLTFKTKDGEGFFEAYWLYLVAGVVLVASLVALYYYSETGHWHGVIEAICIASALTLTVDPFVKERLGHEVSKSIFYHVIGFELPPEMQDRLRTYLRGLEYYRESLSITVKALRIEGEEVFIEITLEGRIVALTQCRYAPSLAFEEVEHGEVHEIWAKRPGTEDKVVEWKSTDGLTPDDEPMTMLYAPKPVELQRGEKLDSFFRFTVRLRKKDYWVQTFGTTTLKTTVKLVPLEHMEMFASHPRCMNPQNRNEYAYNKVFIVGENIHVRWRVNDGK